MPGADRAGVRAVGSRPFQAGLWMERDGSRRLPM